MSDKKQILRAIAVVAKRLRRAPALLEFVRVAGISKNEVMKEFGRWNVAVRAAGLKPLRLKKRPSDEELLKDWGETVRMRGALPSRVGYRRAGKYYPRTLERRFGGWAAMPQAFLDFARDKTEWADVVAVLEVLRAEDRRLAKRRLAPDFRAGEVNYIALRDRPLCGNPLDFRGLRHEPLNEQGVVLLFGMLAKDLGFMIEMVQKDFPDCEAKRQIAPDRWQRVRIEFEYESKNFLLHGHPANGADLIVCWRHNWPKAPSHLEILELSSVIQSLPALG